MKTKTSKLIILPLMLMLFIQACSPKAEEASAATQTPEVQVQVETPKTEPDHVEIQHVVIPGFASNLLGSQKDDEESTSHIVLRGDDFNENQFERPFSQQAMDYMPDVDIQQYAVGSDDNFYYIDITIAGANPSTQNLAAYYAAELDLNHDGRGDILLLATPPFATDWTSNGVQVFLDKNGDVGGANVILSDSSVTGDGYETKIFDSGSGEDPDLAWVHYSLGVQATFGFAIKKSALGNETGFMLGVLASASAFNPATFNLNDGITIADAGSPIKGAVNYPIKLLAAIDNTCRIAVGFQVNGSEPFGCFYPTVDNNGSQGNNEEASDNNGSQSSSSTTPNEAIAINAAQPNPNNGPTRCSDPNGCSAQTP